LLQRGLKPKVAAGFMANALIIGYGNPLRGDDGLGWHTARLLADVAAAHDAEVITCHQLMPELAQPISEVAVVIFVDAAREGPPGRLDWRRVEGQAGPVSYTHHISPESLLSLARELYGRSPRAFVVSVAAGSFECGEELSPAVRAALPALVKRVKDMLSEKT
jgi:hydrogenase maturation protease